MLITDFYANREIFITGASGFLGKSLIEKLLRDCREVKTLYILLRGKKSSSVEQRFEELKQCKVFNRIRKECPEVFNKLHYIEGDSKELGLGIKAQDLELIQNVSIIFHMAANVKFDDPLRNSILLNTRGTHELIKIAENLKNLVVFLHCSTAYCNPLKDVIEERVYKMSADWRKTIKIAENFDEYTLNALYMKYTGHFPNTYTFTKNLSEQLIQEYATKLPLLIFRPSVVLQTLIEPEPGWIDNLNGPLAATVGSAIGVLPIGFTEPTLKLDCIPVDLVTRFTLIAAYKRGLQHLRKSPVPNNLEVINCAAHNLINVSIEQYGSIFFGKFKENPMENCIWSYNPPYVTNSFANYFIQTIILNLPLALTIDFLLYLTKREPKMLKTTRRIMYSLKAISFFATKEFQILNKNMMELEKETPECELFNDVVSVEFFIIYKPTIASLSLPHRVPDGFY